MAACQTPDDGMNYILAAGGDDPRKCSSGAIVCTAFAGGAFEDTGNCVGYDKAPTSGEVAEAAAGGAFEDTGNCVGYDKAPMSGEVAEAAAGGHNILLVGPPGTGKTVSQAPSSSVVPSRYFYINDINDLQTRGGRQWL